MGGWGAESSSAAAPRRVLDHAMTDANIPGYLGAELVVRGRVSGEGDLTIEGSFEGELNLQGDLRVGGRGRVRAPVIARRVAVEGRLEGDVEAAEVIVREGGRLVGDVRAPRVGLEDGGALLGTVEMDVELPEFE